MGEDLGVPGDWSTTPEFMKPRVVETPKVKVELTPQQRVEAAKHELEFRLEQARDPNNPTTGDIEPLLDATQEDIAAKAALAENDT